MTTEEKQEQGPIEKALEVTSVPAVVEVNFDTVKGHIEQMMERYQGLTFTEETLPEARRDATELNKLAQSLDRRRKDAVAAVSEPIRAFDAQMKELVGLVKGTRAEITHQIEAFNERKKALVADLLPSVRAEQWEKQGVREEYHSAEFDDLITQASLTPGGKLTKGAVDKVKERVRADRARQDRVDRRLLELENASRKAGLSAPLTHDNVRHIIQTESDESYQQEVQRLIDAELEREARMRREIEERDRRHQEAQERANEGQPEKTYPEGEETITVGTKTERTPPPPESVEGLDPDAKYEWSVWAEFVVAVDPRASREHIERELRKAIERAKFKGLASVHAEFKGVVTKGEPA